MNLKISLDNYIPSGGTLSSVSFESLSERGVSELTLKGIKDMNLTTMTEIQAKSIGPLLEGRYVKSFAFEKKTSFNFDDF